MQGTSQGMREFTDGQDARAAAGHVDTAADSLKGLL